MRAAILVVALAACTPDIVNDAYDCGENESCPTGLVCNATSGLCESTAQPFDCSAIDEPAGEGNTPETGLPVTGLDCASGLHAITSCVTAADAVDWYAFDAPATCAGLTLHAQVIADRAFAQIYLSYAEDGVAGSVADTACGDLDDDAPTRTRCLVAPLTEGSHVAVGISRMAGDGTDCDGDCAFNKYQLGLQLSTH